MDSLNDLIWTDEDEDAVAATRNILIYVACLVSCEMNSAGCCGGNIDTPYTTTSTIDEYCVSC